jgi:cytochrome c peroxidase
VEGGSVLSDGRWRALALIALIAIAGCREENNESHYVSQAPLDAEVRAALAAAGVHAPKTPAPEDPRLVELGRLLFFDKELSGNRDISCATCHTPVAGTGDNLPVSIGTGGVGSAELRMVKGTASLIPRNAPGVFNLGVDGMHAMFWDSRVSRDPRTGELATPESGLNGAAPALSGVAAPLDSALAAQAMFPVTSREEMRGQPGDNEIADAVDNEQVWERLMERLGKFTGYRDRFEAAFGVSDFDTLSFGHAARAIAAFEREAWTALDSPFDRYLRGDDDALTEEEKRGALLFATTASCTSCHNGPLLTDLGHHAIAAPQVGPGKNAPNDDLGRELETGDAADAYKFRTPPLRNVALTGPWTHSGAYTTLEAVIRHHLDPVGALLSYDETQLRADFRSTVDSDAGRNADRAAALDPALPPPSLTDDEVEELVAFLNALTDPTSLNLLRDAPATVPSGLPVAD